MRSTVVVCLVMAACGDNDSPSWVTAEGADPGENVIFIDNDAGLIAEVAADSDGTAQAEMPDGGSVLLLSSFFDAQGGQCAGEVVTVTPGNHDHVVFERVFNLGDTMTATFTPVPGADSTTISTSCGTTTVLANQPPSATLTFNDGCHGSTLDVLMVASGAALAAPVFTSVSGIPYEDGGTFEITGTPTAMQTFTVTLHNLHAELGDGNIDGFSIGWGALLATTTIEQAPVTVPPPTSTTVTVQFPYPQGFGTGSVVSVKWNPYSFALSERVDIQTPTASTAIDIDLDELRPPGFSGISGTNAGVDWVTGPANLAADVPDAASIDWSGEWNGVSATYHIKGPSSGRLGMPRLPDKYAMCDPNGSQVFLGLFQQVTLVNYKQIDGYEQFLEQPNNWFDELGHVEQLSGQEIHRSMLVGRTRFD